jgi:hypothetical protein
LPGIHSMDLISSVFTHNIAWNRNRVISLST